MRRPFTVAEPAEARDRDDTVAEPAEARDRTSKVTGVVPPAFMETVCFCSNTTALVSGLRNLSTAVPVRSFSLVLKIRAEIVAASPSRRKRGMLGWIITSFWATDSPSMVP